jgi:hypothetical protein
MQSALFAPCTTSSPYIHLQCNSILFPAPHTILTSTLPYQNHVCISYKCCASRVSCSSMSQRPAVPWLKVLQFHVSTSCSPMTQRPTVPWLNVLHFHVSDYLLKGSSLNNSLLHLCIISSLHTQIFPSALCPQTPSTFVLAVIWETKFYTHTQRCWVRDKNNFVLNARQDSALNCWLV